MRNCYKIAILSSVFLFSLTGCQGEDIKEARFLETSDTFEYYEGKCYQASRNDIVETAFIFNLPLNPEDDPSEYKYDLTWNKVVNTDHFTFTGGLEGKRVIEVFRWSDSIIKINYDGRSVDKEATSGYIKISPSAFKAHTKRAQSTYLYAYVAVGDEVGLVDKPNLDQE